MAHEILQALMNHLFELHRSRLLFKNWWYYNHHALPHVHLTAFFSDRALQFGGPGGPVHVKLVVEWDLTTKEW